jgi:Ni,Fe-hydrogenase I cytochrome b subunit
MTAMDWIQTLSIMGTVIATGYYIHREVQADIRAANLRTDRLYEMFIDLLKAQK